MQIAIMTCDRPVNYLADTLGSYAAKVGLPLLLSQGSDTDANLKEASSLLAEIPHATKRPRIPQDADVRVKSTLNYIACLRGEGDLALFEDDVAFSSLTRRTLHQLEGTEHIVALYHCYPPEPGDSLTVPYGLDGFYGTQGMYYPASVREPLADYMMTHLGREPYDLLIKAWCMGVGHDMLALRHCVVQHMGVTTTGLGHHHTTGNFVP
jgi:hypothetical protein